MPMTVEEAQSRLCDQLRLALDGELGPGRFDTIAQGHRLALAESWISSLLFSDVPASGRSKKKSAVTEISSPLMVLEKIAEVAKTYFRTPGVEVECGLGSFTAALGFEQGIDRNERKIAFATRHFEGVRFEARAITDLEAGKYGTLLTKFNLGQAALRERSNPVFLPFCREADRVLKSGGRLIVADMDQFQDNIIEPLVALEHEILDVVPLTGSGITLVVTEK